MMYAIFQTTAFFQHVNRGGIVSVVLTVHVSTIKRKSTK